MNEITFMRSNGGKLKVSKEAFAAMNAYAQRLPEQPEAGGILLGRHITESSDIVIDYITVPMLGDVQTRTMFYRKSLLHQKEIQRLWSDSNGTCTYLGEWHTHPQPLPVPSYIDKENWCTRITMDLYEGESLFFVILGINASRAWEVCASDNGQLHMDILDVIHYGPAEIDGS